MGHRGAAGRPCHTPGALPPATPGGPGCPPLPEPHASDHDCVDDVTLPRFGPAGLAPAAWLRVAHMPGAAQGRAPREGEGSPWPGTSAEGRRPRAPTGLPRPLPPRIACSTQLSTWPRRAPGENRTLETTGQARSALHASAARPSTRPPLGDCVVRAGRAARRRRRGSGRPGPGPRAGAAETRRAGGPASWGRGRHLGSLPWLKPVDGRRGLRFR